MFSENKNNTYSVISCCGRCLQRHLSFTVHVLPGLLLERHFGVVSVQLKENGQMRAINETEQEHANTERTREIRHVHISSPAR